MTSGRPTTLLLLRHGRTEWNRTGRWHGQADVPLDELGVRQAKAFAELVPKLRPDAVVASPLRRATQTAASAAAALGTQVAFDKRLLEVDVGEWEGLVDAEVFGLDPAFQRLRGSDRRFSATGETPTECGERVAGALADLAATYAGKRVLVVSHAYAIRAGIGCLLGWGLGATSRLAGLYNCAYGEFCMPDGNGWQLISWNNCNSRIPGQRGGEVMVV